MKPISLVALSLSLIWLVGCGPKPADKSEGKPEGGAAAVSGATEVAAPVRTSAAKEQEVLRTVAVTGNVAATESVELAPKVAARLTFIGGREGEAVRKGQIVLQQDTADYETQVRSANAQIESANAQIKSADAQIRSSEASYQNALVKLAQAQTNLTLAEAQIENGVKDAQQQVQSSKSQLELAKRPQRTQEVTIAENAVAQAQANYEKAVVDRKRYAELVKEGAAAKSVLEQYETQEKVAEAALNTAKAQLDIARIGGRDESIRQSETTVSRAEFGLKLANANRQQLQVRRDDVKAAQAGVAQAKAAVGQARAGLSSAQATLSSAQSQLASAQLQVANCTVVSPIDGIIAKRSAEVGQLVGPTAAALTIVTLDTVFFEAQVPETDIGNVKIGMTVSVSVDAVAGKTFEGTVAKLYPTGSTSSRAFVVRVSVPNPARTLRPGMFARGSVVLEKRRGVVVPKDAIVATEDGKLALFVAKNGKAERRIVTVGVQTAEISEILTGVASGEPIIVVGQGGLADGAAIKVVGDPTQTAKG